MVYPLSQWLFISDDCEVLATTQGLRGNEYRGLPQAILVIRTACQFRAKPWVSGRGPLQRLIRSPGSQSLLFLQLSPKANSLSSAPTRITCYSPPSYWSILYIPFCQLCWPSPPSLPCPRTREHSPPHRRFPIGCEGVLPKKKKKNTCVPLDRKHTRVLLLTWI